MSEIVSILPYNSGSKSVLSLALALNGMDFPVIGEEGRIAHSTPNKTGLKFKILREHPTERDKNRRVINWGNQYVSEEFVDFNMHISGFNLPLESIVVAKSPKNIYISKTTDIYGFNSYKIVTEPGNGDLIAYFPKSQEYHIHYWNNQIFLCEQKYHRLRTKDNKIVGKENVNWRIRSYNNGFLLRETTYIPNAVFNEAMALINKSKKRPDFGVLKLLYSADKDQAILYEYSPTPILYKEYQVMAYANQIRKVVG